MVAGLLDALNSTYQSQRSLEISTIIFSRLATEDRRLNTVAIPKGNTTDDCSIRLRSMNRRPAGLERNLMLCAKVLQLDRALRG